MILRINLTSQKLKSLWGSKSFNLNEAVASLVHVFSISYFFQTVQTNRFNEIWG